MIKRLIFRKRTREHSFISQTLKQYYNEQPTNLTWAEEETGLWKGWTYNPVKKRYYFDDIGNESIMGLWETQWAREGEE